MILSLVETVVVVARIAAVTCALHVSVVAIVRVVIGRGLVGLVCRVAVESAAGMRVTRTAVVERVHFDDRRILVEFLVAARVLAVPAVAWRRVGRRSCLLDREILGLSAGVGIVVVVIDDWRRVLVLNHV